MVHDAAPCAGQQVGVGARRGDRRALLKSVGILTGAMALGVRRPSDARAQAAASAPRPLWRRAIAKGLLFGCQIRDEDLDDGAYGDAVARDGVLLTASEYTMNVVRNPTLAQFDFSHAGRLRNFGAARDMVLSGANLVWDRGVSEAVEAEIRRREAARSGSAQQIMEHHIASCVARAEYRMHSWNVVNEPIATQEGRADGLRASSVWFETIGPDYIAAAFATAAAKRASGALLMLNEFGLETGPAGTSTSFTAEAKRAALLALLQQLLDDGVPIEALGVQAHLDSGNLRQRFRADDYRDFLADVAGLGLKILVTELDVRDNAEPSDIEQRDRAVAATYRNYLDVALDEPAVIAVSTWGWADHYSWLQVEEAMGSREPRPDGLPLRPLLLGPNLGRKKAWFAVASALDAAPTRTLTTPVPLRRMV